MKLDQAIRRSLAGLSILALCSCGSSSDVRSVVTAPSASRSLDLVNRFSLPGPGDQVTAEASINPSGHLVYTVLKKEFEGSSLDYEGLVLLDRPGEGSRTLTSHALKRTTIEQITEFHEPQLDTSGDFASWRETAGGQTKIGYLAQGGGVAYWNPPTGSHFIKNLGVESNRGHRLYALLESQGVHTLLRFTPAKGEVAEYVLPGIASGTLDLIFDGTCQYATGIASDGQMDQLIYIVNSDRPSVQVLTTEPIQTFTVNNRGDVGYTNQNSDLIYLRPEQTNNQGTGFPTPTMVDTQVLSDSPAVLMGNLFQANGQAISNVIQNSVNGEQSTNITNQASTLYGVNAIYSTDTAAGGQAAMSALLFVTPESAITNANYLIPPTFGLEALDIEGETATMVVGRDQGGSREVQILRGRVPQ